MSTFTVRGTRDFLPEDQIARQRMIDIIRETYEEFGFSPLETPALERAEVLLLKSESIRDEIYIFKDKSGREIGLRFDHTVPLARVIAQNPQIPLPFRRYAIGKVWRYDRPQSGRYREFVQADIDIVGSKDILSDAETVWAGVTALKRVGTPSFTLFFNSRRLIDGWGESVGLQGERLSEFVRSVDKWMKIGEDGVREELRKKGLEQYLDSFLELETSVEELPESNETLKMAKEELLAFKEYMDDMKIPSSFDPKMVRGLDYYTGVVFETYINDNPSLGSIGSGGRYDELIRLLSGRDVPATGYSIGVDRLFDILSPPRRRRVTQVFVASIAGKRYTLRILSLLREVGIPSESDVMARNLRKQLEYAHNLGIPLVIIAGPKEEQEEKVRIRHMDSGEEKEIAMEDMIGYLKAFLK